MTEQHLTTLLQELAADAETADFVDLAPEAWRVAGERRRSRRLTGGAAVVAASLVVAAVAATTQQGGHRPPVHSAISSPTPTATAQAAPQLAPERAAESRLPYVDSPLPRSIDTSKAAVAALPLLTSSPVQRAVALAESTSDYETPAPIVVVGSDGKARRMNGITLSWVVDSGLNRSVPLDNGSLSPDGTHAALAQTGQVVLVDLRTGIAHFVPVPGNFDTVSWAAASDEILITGDSGAALVSLATHQVTPLGGTDPTATRFLLAGSQPLVLSTEDVPHIDSWWGQAFASGHLVAVGAFGTGVQVAGAGTDSPQVLAVVDVDDPSEPRLLAFDWTDRYKGCCNALGWLNDSTVLFSSAGGDDRVRILAWTPSTGAVGRVSEVSNGSVVSVAAG